ncbi:MAG: hypothetical protein MUF64_12300 [Polyangiaceae bacterium]|nr:hypothetical protein [Polyangiaceae bacterium]
MRLSPGLLFLAALSSFSRSACAQQDPPLDLRYLFSRGALSPGYPRLHAGSSGQPLALAGGGADGPRHTIFSVLVNPALFAFGVWAGRVELAPIPYLSVLAEYNRIQDFEVPKLRGNIHLDGNVVDLGLHFWPMGEGAAGFYLGPRYSFGSGTDNKGLGEGSLSGWGADLGYQWVAGVFAFNLGAGLGHATARVRPSAELRARVDIPEVLRQLEATETFLRPYLTVAIGLAF